MDLSLISFFVFVFLLSEIIVIISVIIISIFNCLKEVPPHFA